MKSCLTDPSCCSDSKEEGLFFSLNKLPDKIRTIIFILVLLSAAGVTLFSLSNKSNLTAKDGNSIRASQSADGDLCCPK